MDIKKPQTLNKRKSIDNTTDPYLISEAVIGMAVCRKCHAVFMNKRWTLNEALYEKKMDEKSTRKVVCPACRKVKDKFPGGVVRIKGEFLAEHKSEIMNLIKNEEQRAKGFNPLERIMSISNIKSGIEIMTTNEKLAQRIGKRLQKTYQGRVYYKWSDDTKLLRAEWER
ncbi:MAG: ATPase [Nitrospiraceae bacterium]|nr:MAG: ATPase [Nitrospiraceae bacterium]